SRPTGELARLVKVSRRRFKGWQLRDEPFLEPQRVAAVLVIFPQPAKLPIAALAIACDRNVVGHMHFEADGAAGGAGRRPRGRLGGASMPPRGRSSRARPRSNKGAPTASALETGRLPFPRAQPPLAPRSLRRSMIAGTAAGCGATDDQCRRPDARARRARRYR